MLGAITGDIIGSIYEAAPIKTTAFPLLLRADVVIDQRSLLEWLFDPIFAAGRR